jgi:hypothetical protein
MRSISTDRFREQLRQQLGFIRNSCESYDRGDRAEGIRIATSLRTLLTDRGRQTSLLTRLGATDVPLLSTAPEIRPTTLAIDWMPVRITSAGMTIEPPLDRTSTKRPLPARQWWKEPVTIVDAGLRVTREDIALVAADRDGGAHVDATLTAAYQKLKTGLWVTLDGKPVSDHHLLHLRQMGFEILNSPELAALSEARR